jgi:hypothetical protein
VSNILMGWLRRLRKALVVTLLSAIALLSATIVASQIEQRLFRRRVELLLSKIQSLELRKTPWSEAQTQFEHWKKYQKPGPQCDAHACSIEMALNEFAFGFLTETSLFLRLDDYFRWRLKLHYDVGPFVHMEEHLLRLYMRVGGRPARVIASIGMRDGIVWGKGISIHIETFTRPNLEHFSGGWYEYTLIGSTHSVPRFNYYGNWLDPQLMLHPNYRIGRPSGCEGCVFGWAEFTPYAAPADVHRLTQIDLSCLTRWQPCTAQTDLMPAAWAQFVQEEPKLHSASDKIGCSGTAIEVLGRDSDNIATGEIIEYQENIDSDGSNWGDKWGLAKVRVLEQLKGDTNWNLGEVHEVRVLLRSDSPDLKLRPALRLFLFHSRIRSEPLQIDLGAPCPVIPLNEANFNLIRRGIDQDYSATDKTD